jgi:hypothetical protein
VPVNESQLGKGNYLLHSYDVKSATLAGALPDADLYQAQLEAQLYTNYPRKTLPNGGTVVGAKAGSVLADIKNIESAINLPANLRILALIEFSVPGMSVRVRTWLPPDTSGKHKVSGVVLYSVEVRSDNPETPSKERALDALRLFKLYPVLRYLERISCRNSHRERPESHCPGRNRPSIQIKRPSPRRNCRRSRGPLSSPAAYW